MVLLLLLSVAVPVFCDGRVVVECSCDWSLGLDFGAKTDFFQAPQDRSGQDQCSCAFVS